MTSVASSRGRCCPRDLVFTRGILSALRARVFFCVSGIPSFVIRSLRYVTRQCRHHRPVGEISTPTHIPSSFPSYYYFASTSKSRYDSNISFVWVVDLLSGRITGQSAIVILQVGPTRKCLIGGFPPTARVLFFFFSSRCLRDSAIFPLFFSYHFSYSTISYLFFFF